MISYAVGLLACLLFLYTPLSQLLLGGGSDSSAPPPPPQIHRTPRPAVKTDLLAAEDWPGNLTCPGDAYSVHLFSKEPLVVYLENFLSPGERAHLLEIR